MASGTGQAISSEELRRRLYQTFKNRGVLDSLKVHGKKFILLHNNPGFIS